MILCLPLLRPQVQCNVFNETDDLAITAGGGRRGVPVLPDVSEEVAMVSKPVFLICTSDYCATTARNESTFSDATVILHLRSSCRMTL